MFAWSLRSAWGGAEVLLPLLWAQQASPVSLWLFYSLFFFFCHFTVPALKDSLTGCCTLAQGVQLGTLRYQHRPGMDNSAWSWSDGRGPGWYHTRAAPLPWLAFPQASDGINNLMIWAFHPHARGIRTAAEFLPWQELWCCPGWVTAGGTEGEQPAKVMGGTKGLLSHGWDVALHQPRCVWGCGGRTQNTIQTSTNLSNGLAAAPQCHRWAGWEPGGLCFQCDRQ